MNLLFLSRLLPALLVMATLASPVQAIWLEGIRWFRHDNFVRVVFDLSAPTKYRVSERLAEGYVDVILQGELTRKMAEEVAINEGGVLSAKQLRQTSTSLTWRIQVEHMSRIRTMSLEELPYKVVVDFYDGAGAAGGATAARAAKGPDSSIVSAEPAKRKAEAPVPQRAAPQRAAKKPTPGPQVATLPAPAKTAAAKPVAKPVTKPAVKVAAIPATKPAAEPVVRPGAKGDPGSPDQRYEGLKPDEKRRLLVGELLLQLSDTNGAVAYLEQVSATQPSHGWTRFLLAQTFMAKGDQFRAKTLIEPMMGQEKWKLVLQPLLARFAPPDAKGEIPGGEIAEEDLNYFVDILKKGASLSTADLYAKQGKASGSFSASTLLSGMGLGALLGLAAFAFAEARRRKAVDGMVRDRVMGMDMSSRGPASRDQAPDYLEVSRRVREELEQVMQAERKDPQPRGVFEDQIISDAPMGEESLEEKVYRLADEKKSIVEIAEVLNLGVDEVRLHLELREQTGRIANA